MPLAVREGVVAVGAPGVAATMEGCRSPDPAPRRRSWRPTARLGAGGGDVGGGWHGGSLAVDGRVGTVKSDPVLLDLPFRGLWLARNSPARRVPSHGTHAFGVTYAIDFIAVDGHGRPAPRTWRTVLAVEPPGVFRGFGEPILAPAGGTVVAVHDGEPDHSARRSQITLVPYALGQRQRVRAGAAAIAGNHVVIALGPDGPFVLTAHLRRGTVRVAPGETVRAGDQIGECGNSGNSTQPHVHVQVTDSVHWPSARGLPMAFRRRHPGGDNTVEPAWMPAESEIVDAGA